MLGVEVLEVMGDHPSQKHKVPPQNPHRLLDRFPWHIIEKRRTTMVAGVKRGGFLAAQVTQTCCCQRRGLPAHMKCLRHRGNA